MDPLAHTLVGACLAGTRLRRWTPLAAPALILGANAPDLDAVTMLVDGDIALGFRRGWTHGVPALAVLPVTLAITLYAIRRDRADVDFRRLLGLCCIGVWTHPALDWLNTYGIRLLMPLDGRWFYGDALFIVDPWVWLLAGTPVFLTQSRSWAGKVGWLSLGAATSLLVWSVPLVPFPARVVWGLGLVAVLGLRVWPRHEPRSEGLSAAALSLLVAYAGAMWAGSVLAERAATRFLAARGVTVQEVMAGPVPANPFVREIVAADGERYHLLELDWLRADPIRIRAAALPRGPQGPVVDAALRAPQVQGLVTWLRFPSFEVESLADGYRVRIRDARHRGRGIGYATVELGRDLSVRPPR